MITKTEAKSRYGLTQRELDSLPFTVEQYTHGRRRVVRHLVDEREAMALAATPAVLHRLAKRSPEAIAARQTKQEDKLRRKYPNWRDALLPACEAMFNLNRYAKHEGCRSKDEIYSLKNALVELLYLQGACVECLAHERTLPAQGCWDCDGTGREERLDREGEPFLSDLACHRCGGSGNWREERIIRDIAFKFMVCGRVFAWHQPDILITFDYEVSAIEQGVPTEEKPVEMSAARMSEGKHIIRYVLANAPALEAA